MPQAPSAVLDGSLEVLQNVAEVGQSGVERGMPKAGLEAPLNGPKQEKWWYEVSGGDLGWDPCWQCCAWEGWQCSVWDRLQPLLRDAAVLCMGGWQRSVWGGWA